MKKITQLFKITVLALVLSFGLSYVYAWTAPTATPPGGNVPAPINISSTSQYKAGALGVEGVLKAFTQLNTPKICLNPASDGTTNCITDWVSGGGVTSVNGQTGDVTVTTGGLVMEGYAPEPINSTEDFYSTFVYNNESTGFGAYNVGISTSNATDSCNNDTISAYQCSPEDNKTCNDIAIGGTRLVPWGDGGMTANLVYNKRQVICAVATAYTKLPAANVVFYFKGSVDTTLDITLQGTTYSETNENAWGNLPNTNRFFGSGIGNLTNLTMVVLNRRCATTSTENTITQQPNSANGYTAKVSLRDTCASPNSSGAAEYEFYLKK